MSHGGDIYSREISLDFSANINPLGMPEAAQDALRAHIADFEAYPDPNCRALRRALAEKEGVGPENIVCGNGAADVIYRLAAAIRPETVLVTAPTFSEYEKAALEAGAEICRYHLREEAGFRTDAGILERIPPRGAVFLASPNNPDGGILDEGLLKRIDERCRRLGTVLILDGCFGDFAETPLRIRPQVVIKAFTKNYAMAGLRLGYAVCEDRILAEKTAARGPCWSVSTPAQIAGLAALGDGDFILRTRRLVARERGFLSAALEGLGFKVYPSKANFLLFRGPVGLDEALLQRKIAIRCCSDYHGLGPEYYRAAVRTREENQRLIDAVSEILREGM